MLTTVLILVALAFALFFIALKRQDDSHKQGIVIGARLFYNYLPLLLLAFLAAGLLQVAIPDEIVRSWLGAEAGFRGILIGSVAGMFIAAGPYVAYPIFASIMVSGAGIGTAVALLTSWSLMTFSKLPFEMALLGPRFTVARYSMVIVMPVIAGFIAHFFFAGVI